MTDSTKIVENGKFSLSVGGNTIGHTEDGVEITFERGLVEIMSHESGVVPIKTIHNGTNVMLTVGLLEITDTNLGYAFPEATTPGSNTATISAGVAGTNWTSKAVRILVKDSDGDTRWLFSNMVPNQNEVKILNRIGEKWVLRSSWKQHYLDSGTRAQYTP